MTSFGSWGRYPKISQSGFHLTWPDQVLGQLAIAGDAGGTLAYGMGRSYGDVCLSESGRVLATSGMNRLLEADWAQGIVRAQAGMTLSDLIAIALPRGWFPVVTPGTQFVTLGGAIANDVHGKNHHRVGTFGGTLEAIRLYRSDRGWVECSSTKESSLFGATIGGLGLTGIITEVTMKLRRIQSSLIDQKTIRFRNLEEFFDVSLANDLRHEYTVSWIDCLSSGKARGRGLYIAGDHALEGGLESVQNRPSRSMPLVPPVSLVNPLSLRLFNSLYYHRPIRSDGQARVGYETFFYPLDAIRHWNRMYGPAGFQQFQCIIPRNTAQLALPDLLRTISKSGVGSFLAVLKQCGSLTSPGILSFPMEGYSLALDFPQREQINASLFKRLDATVHEAGGRLYPAKDAHMSGQDFKKGYPRWTELEALRDPAIQSKFWKRVMQ